MARGIPISGDDADQKEGSNDQQPTQGLQPPGPPVPDQPPASGQGPTGDRPKSSRLEIARFIVEIITLFVLFWYAMTTHHQWREMRRSVKESKRSADAAKSAAVTARETLVISERPWVVNAGMRPVYGSLPVQEFQVEVVLKNVGRSPAMNFGCSASWYIGAMLPDPPPFQEEGTGYISNQTLGPGLETLSQNRVDVAQGCKKTLGNAAPSEAIQMCKDTLLRNVEERTAQFFVYGHTEYEDQFGNPHGLLFCQWWTSTGWALCDRYNQVW